MAQWLSKLGMFIFRTRWITILTWGVILIIAGITGGDTSQKLTGGGGDVPGSESVKVKEIFSQEFEKRGSPSLLLVVKDQENKVNSSIYTDKLREVLKKLEQEKEVKSITSMLDADDKTKQSMIGSDEKTTISYVELNIDENKAVKILPEIQERFNKNVQNLDIDAHLVGSAAVMGDMATFSQSGLVKAEMIVLPLIFIILFLIFRSLVATLIPFIITILAITGATGIIGIAASYMEMSVFVMNATMMLGLGVGVDYSLFMVNRFRIELEKEKDVKKALKVTMHTAGHSVIFSGLTVIGAMSILFIVNIPAIKSLAFGAIAVVFVAMLATLTLLPAILLLLGERINWGTLKWFSKRNNKNSSGWIKWSKLVMKRPVIFLMASLILLISLAIPSYQLKLFSPDVTILPEESNVKKGFKLLQDTFGKGRLSPHYVVLESEEDIVNKNNLQYLSDLVEKLNNMEQIKEVTTVLPAFEGVPTEKIPQMLSSSELPKNEKEVINNFISKDRKYMVVEFITQETAASKETRDLIENLREDIKSKMNIPKELKVYVGGETAISLDHNNEIFTSLLPSILLMLALIYIVLLITFKSILLPLKAILLNLISIGATYGILILIFIKGYGANLLGIEVADSIVSFVPVLLLALLFGLSTDYEVFLMSRVQEEYRKTNNNEQSIAIGLQETGPLISGAALLMIAVFTGFAFSGMLPIQVLGIGLAVGIFLDATIVRLVLVPVSMVLLGKWNWWLPSFSNKVSKKEKALNKNRDRNIM
ncbi:MMPL family transporter [Bacillus pacificus]|uniref:MMPL family transporter n=1 Tax=Bacillus pacificus TaxID=2026187 RepID=UPI00156B1B29|nr:MMPL family transporter [Bacillus pacificus]MDA2169257.1 MMPL family transporter [Bacillus cereus]NRR17662.1 MMPL family transporter [Bacillus pacificus]